MIAKSVDAGLGGWTADNADGLARAFAGSGVGLGPLTANRQPAQMADAAIALDTLQPLKVHANLAAQVAFDDVLAVLNGMHNLRELLLGEILGADAGIDTRLGQNDFRVAGTNAVNVAQRNIDTLVWRNFHPNDTSHIFVRELTKLNESKGATVSPAVVCGEGWYRSRE